MVTLAPIAITSTSQQYLVSVVENLCQAYCAISSVQPTGTVTFSVLNQQTSGTQTIVTINAAVSITYTPRGMCKAVSRQFSEQFQVAFISTTSGSVPTIALTPLTTVIGNEYVKCNNNAYGVSLATPLTIAATFPAA